MPASSLMNRVAGIILLLGGVVLVGLLSGVGSASLTDDPPTINPYESTGGGTIATTTAPPPTADTQVAATTTPPRLEVAIENFSFAPVELAISAGTTVEFVNRESGVPHTSTSDDNIWDSDTLSPGDSFAFTFDTPGSFSYFCSIHPGMKAEISVEE